MTVLAAPLSWSLLRVPRPALRLADLSSGYWRKALDRWRDGANLAYMDEQDKHDERVKFLAKLPPDLHHWLKVTSAESGENMNDLLVSALEAWRENLQALWAGKKEGGQS